MAASDVLATLYVDVVARGVVQAQQQIRGLMQSMRQGGGAGGGGGTGGGAAGIAGQLMGGNVSGLARGLGVAGGAAAGLAATLAHVKTVMGQIEKGLAGTVEGDRLSGQFLQVSREIAAVFLPAVNAASTVMHDLIQSFRAGGSSLQDFATLILGPVGVAFRLLSHPEVVGGVRRMIAAFGQLNQALAPIRGAMMQLAGTLARMFVIEPILLFVKALESALRIATALAGVVVAAGRGLGLVGRDAGGGPARRQVTLNQTGTETPEGTYQRFQEAALKAGMPEEVSPQEKYLAAIDTKVGQLVGFINTLGKGAEQMTDPGRLARGVGNAGLDVADFIFGQLGLFGPGKLAGVR